MAQTNEHYAEYGGATPQPAGIDASGGADSRDRPRGTVEEETEPRNQCGSAVRLVLLAARLISGSKVLLQHKKTQEEHECHVAFLGPVRGGKAEIGLEFTTPHPTFWRVRFRPKMGRRGIRKRGPRQIAIARDKVAVPEKIIDK